MDWTGIKWNRMEWMDIHNETQQQNDLRSVRDMTS